jgi:hypothetical protein
LKPNTLKPAIVASGNVENEIVKIQKKFGFDETIRIKTIGVKRGHPIIEVTGVDTHRTVKVEISKVLGLKPRRVRGISSKRAQSYITIKNIANGSLVYEKSTRSGGPKDKLRKAL